MIIPIVHYHIVEEIHVNSNKPFFYEIKEGNLININACTACYVYQDWMHYYVIFEIGGDTHKLKEGFDSKEKAILRMKEIVNSNYQFATDI